MSKHVLLTGFEPFGDHKVNPSELLVRSLEGRVIAGRLVAVRVFPVESRSLRDRIEAAIHEEEPEFVVGTGVAAGLPSLALERVAINMLDFSIPDNAGTQRKNDAIARGGPEARLSTLPLDQIVDGWKSGGIPGYVSNSAGTFLCNQWLYETLSVTMNATPPVPVGFVHLPLLPGQASDAGAERTPSMTLDLMRKGIESLIETVFSWIESRPASPTTKATGQMWIPRGIREVER